jgi:hypothetical protein
VHGWDSGVAGFYIVTRENIQEWDNKNTMSKKKIEAIIDAELEDYTKWANGYVYCFLLYGKDGEVVDSCGGFYDINDIKDALPDEWKDEDLSDYLKY